MPLNRDQAQGYEELSDELDPVARARLLPINEEQVVTEVFAFSRPALHIADSS